jgi:hypothetical protein
LRSLVEVFPADAERAMVFRNQAHVHVHAVRPPLVRNKIIVDRSELLIATPFHEKEILRSGTWMTIRYARSKVIPVLFIWPEGDTELS